MKILIDTNVALDILLRRQDYANAALVFSLTQHGIISSYISASAITDIFYLSQKDLGKKAAREHLKSMLRVFKPATVTADHIHQALDFEWDDFEDSVQYVVGESFSADYIVTGNVMDFTTGEIPAITPERFLKTISVIED